jgi:hypothetical protein
MPTDTLTADPELQRERGPESIPETPHDPVRRDDQNLDGAATETPAREGNDVEGGGPDGGEVSLLAYRYWQERGCPDGCPDDDWYRAERELAETRTNSVRG